MRDSIFILSSEENVYYIWELRFAREKKMVGVVGVLLFFVLSVSNAQSTEATRFVLDRMSKNGVGLQESEFEVLWVQILGDENHTLVSTNGTNYTLCNTSTNVFLEEDTDGYVFGDCRGTEVLVDEF